ADDLTFIIVNRQGSGKKPSILTIFAPKRKSILPRLTGRERTLDTFHHASHFFGMMDFLPAPPLHFFQRGSSVIVPTLVVPENVTFGIRHPCKLRNGVS